MAASTAAPETGPVVMARSKHGRLMDHLGRKHGLVAYHRGGCLSGGPRTQQLQPDLRGTHHIQRGDVWRTVAHVWRVGAAQ